MLADARPSALLLLAPYSIVLQMLPSPQSLQMLPRRLCWQMLLPPHSQHRLLLRVCWQMLHPPHSLHRLFCRLCSHCPALPPRARLPLPLLLASSPPGAARFSLPSPRLSFSPSVSRPASSARAGSLPLPLLCRNRHLLALPVHPASTHLPRQCRRRPWRLPPGPRSAPAWPPPLPLPPLPPDLSDQ